VHRLISAFWGLPGRPPAGSQRSSRSRGVAPRPGGSPNAPPLRDACVRARVGTTHPAGCAATDSGPRARTGGWHPHSPWGAPLFWVPRACARVGTARRRLSVAASTGLLASTATAARPPEPPPGAVSVRVFRTPVRLPARSSAAAGGCAQRHHRQAGGVGRRRTPVRAGTRWLPHTEPTDRRRRISQCRSPGSRSTRQAAGAKAKLFVFSTKPEGGSAVRYLRQLTVNGWSRAPFAVGKRILLPLPP
jgi:hypothetical protein